MKNHFYKRVKPTIHTNY